MFVKHLQEYLDKFTEGQNGRRGNAVSNARGHFFTIELKVTKGNKIKFSPHQISFHTRHPHNTFILVQALGSGAVKLYEGSKIMELDAWGLKLEACRLGLEASYSFLSELGA